MKRIIALVLICVLLTSCATQSVSMTNQETTVEMTVDSLDISNFKELDNPDLLSYFEETVYSELVSQLNDENYFVENIDAIYISKEYLEEMAYNSQSNIFFGYTLSELGELFQDTSYVFTLGEDGQTTVKEFEKYDDTWERILENIAVGTGIILICVTVSVVTGALGATAVSMVFATSAKTGTLCALSTGTISAVTSGVVKGIETDSIEEALKAAALSGSEGYKWGAIGGTLSGGIEKTASLYGATRNGLTMNQAAIIQKESKLPLEFIKKFHSVDEYNVFKNAGSKLEKVNGKWALTQKMDWNFIGDINDGRTNAERVLDGLAPLDSTGKSYELHHIGQKKDSPLAILTSKQHKSNYKILHTNTGQSKSEIDRNLFAKEKQVFWESFLEKTKEVI